MVRNFQKLLEYDEWRNFLKAIDKAKFACQNSGHQIRDHFVELNKMVPVGSSASRDISGIALMHVI